MRKNSSGYVVILCIILGAVFLAMNKGGVKNIDPIKAQVSERFAKDTMVYRKKKAEVPGQDSTVIRRYLVLDVELNSATFEELDKVYGIGEVFASRILDYRKELGGYYSIEQLREIKGIDDKVFTRISRNFRVDTLAISKININFATRKALLSHPYFTASMVKRIEDAKMRGGYFTSTEQIIEQDILLKSEALRVAPYLLYTVN
ncbi:MAG: helix-hairpin-helix domain-containing protein [Rikenellaceae bacterium]